MPTFFGPNLRCRMLLWCYPRNGKLNQLLAHTHTPSVSPLTKFACRGKRHFSCKEDDAATWWHFATLSDWVMKTPLARVWRSKINWKFSSLPNCISGHSLKVCGWKDFLVDDFVREGQLFAEWKVFYLTMFQLCSNIFKKKNKNHKTHKDDNSHVRTKRHFPHIIWQTSTLMK